ncbi:hypothetical protein NDU88_006304 [Pleurodeles waltl]|uniref:Uncharacterized protein n=1 Tax=Pleurodeles waltl TaxID=8319 RepID=A0AAV7PHX9_PLEWA|nr:hypothetical protein NDU88_006304 [Pleurodeles waltl]
MLNPMLNPALGRSPTSPRCPGGPRMILLLWERPTEEAWTFATSPIYRPPVSTYALPSVSELRVSLRRRALRPSR